MGRIQIIAPATQIGHPPPGLRNEKPSRRGIPGHQFEFPEPVEPAGGNISHVESGRPGPPDCPGIQGHITEIIYIIIHTLLNIIGETRCQKTLSQIRRPGNMDGLAIQKSAATFFRGEHLIQHRVVDSAATDFPFYFQSNGNTKDGIAMSIICRPSKGSIIHRKSEPLAIPCDSSVRISWSG